MHSSLLSYFCYLHRIEKTRSKCQKKEHQNVVLSRIEAHKRHSNSQHDSLYNPNAQPELEHLTLHWCSKSKEGKDVRLSNLNKRYFATTPAQGNQIPKLEALHGHECYGGTLSCGAT